MAVSLAAAVVVVAAVAGVAAAAGSRQLAWNRGEDGRFLIGSLIVEWKEGSARRKGILTEWLPKCSSLPRYLSF